LAQSGGEHLEDLQRALLRRVLEVDLLLLREDVDGDVCRAGRGEG
jgi:hypothetical protein